MKRTKKLSAQKALIEAKQLSMAMMAAQIEALCTKKRDTILLSTFLDKGMTVRIGKMRFSGLIYPDMASQWRKRDPANHLYLLAPGVWSHECFPGTEWYDFEGPTCN